MSTRRIFLLHPGYGKVGTTTLQSSFFDPLARLGLIHYFGMFLNQPKGHPDRILFDDLQAAMYLSRDSFELEKPRIREMLSVASERSDPTTPMVLSNEHFLLSSYSTSKAGLTIRAEETARRLAELLDDFDVRLLVGVRRQDAMIRALFIEAASRTGHANAAQFDNLEAFIARSTEPHTLFNAMFDYSSSIRHYEINFPCSPLRLYSYESFVAKQSRLLQSICDLIGIPRSALTSIPQPLPNLNRKKRVSSGVEINQRSGVAKVLRSLPGGLPLANLLHQSAILRYIYELVRPKVTIPNLTQNQSMRIMTVFRDGNIDLASRHVEFGRELEEFGYTARDSDTVGRSCR